MVERPSNTSLNEKNLSRAVQELAPLMLELPELHITHGWEHTDICRLLCHSSLTLTEPPPDPAPAQQGPCAAEPLEMLSPASSPAACALQDPSMMFCCYLNPAFLSSNPYWWVIDTILWHQLNGEAFTSAHHAVGMWDGLFTYLYMHTLMHSQELL